MAVFEINLYKELVEKIGEKSAQSLIEFVKAEVELKVSAEKNQLATKQDIQELRLEIEKAKTTLLQWFMGGMFGFSALIVGLIKLL